VHGYLNLQCLFDSLTRQCENDVTLTLVKCLLSSTFNAYIGNELYIVLRLLHDESSKNNLQNTIIFP
jgi:hypothetical protein